jgi:hypothetical protein
MRGGGERAGAQVKVDVPPLSFGGPHNVERRFRTVLYLSYMVLLFLINKN